MWGSCRCICPSSSGNGSQRLRRRRKASGWMSFGQPSLRFTRIIDKTARTTTELGVETQPQKWREAYSNHVDVCSPPPPTPLVSVSQCLRWQTWRNIPLPTFLHACRHVTELVPIATTVSTDFSGWCLASVLGGGWVWWGLGGGGGWKMWLGGNTVRRGMKEDMALLFALSSLGLGWLWLLQFLQLRLCVTTMEWNVVSFSPLPSPQDFFFFLFSSSQFHCLHISCATFSVLIFGVQPLAVTGKVTSVAMFPSVIIACWPGRRAARDKTDEGKEGGECNKERG